MPAIGIVVVGAAGLAFAVAVPALLLAPLLAVGGSLLGILLTPWHCWSGILRPRPSVLSGVGVIGHSNPEHIAPGLFFRYRKIRILYGK